MIRESLRLWPPAPVLNRMVDSGGPLPAWEGVQLPENTVAFVCPILLGRDTASWGSDAAEFRPDRGRPSHPFAYLPFGYGPRGCVGQRLALAELRAFLRAVLAEFRVSPGKAAPDVEWFLSLRLRDGLRLQLERR